jgi:hypothetical protein
MLQQNAQPQLVTYEAGLPIVNLKSGLIPSHSAASSRCGRGELVEQSVQLGYKVIMPGGIQGLAVSRIHLTIAPWHLFGQAS